MVPVRSMVPGFWRIVSGHGVGWCTAQLHGARNKPNQTVSMLRQASVQTQPPPVPWVGGKSPRVPAPWVGGKLF